MIKKESLRNVLPENLSLKTAMLLSSGVVGSLLGGELVAAANAATNPRAAAIAEIQRDEKALGAVVTRIKNLHTQGINGTWVKDDGRVTRVEVSAADNGLHDQYVGYIRDGESIPYKNIYVFGGHLRRYEPTEKALVKSVLTTTGSPEVAFNLVISDSANHSTVTIDAQGNYLEKRGSKVLARSSNNMGLASEAMDEYLSGVANTLSLVTKNHKS